MIWMLGSGWAAEGTFLLLLLAMAGFSYGAYLLGARKPPDGREHTWGEVLGAYCGAGLAVLLLCRGLSALLLGG
jgi:hypothetical protein